MAVGQTETRSRQTVPTQDYDPAEGARPPLPTRDASSSARATPHAPTSPHHNGRRSTAFYRVTQSSQTSAPNWETKTDTSTAQGMAPANGSGKKRCKKCGETISGHFVRALGSSYHLECFTCADCGKECAAKFFPVEDPAGSGSQVPLCEHCYFSRLGLLCYRCNDALRGSYITALDRKYHVEHFTCSVCPQVFGPDDSYYEHDGEVFCHYHYSTRCAATCEGCHSAILKHFVETYRGGVEHQWHPECYMIFKFWNVKLAPELLPRLDTGTQEVLDSEEQPSEVISKDNPSQAERAAILDRELYVDALVLEIWTTLCGFEEATAASISQMLQCAVNHSYQLALGTTEALVGAVRVLFDALEPLPLDDEEHKLGKEPKTLCRKIVSYMSLVTKNRQENTNSKRTSSAPPDLLGVANSLAHYLKVLIRYGLSTSLAVDRRSTKHPTLRRFLSDVSKYKTPPTRLPVSALTSDRCVGCQKTVEDTCYMSRDRLWHINCLSCVMCNKDLTGASQSTPSGDPLCKECASKETNAIDAEFKLVSRLGQYIFLLYVAVARFELVLGQQSSGREPGKSVSTPALILPKESSSSQHSRPRMLRPPSHVEDLTTHKFLDSSSRTDSESHGTSKKSIDIASLSTNKTPPAALERTSDLLHSRKELTLDDIRRIVAAEQARDQIPNAFRHQNKAIGNALDVEISHKNDTRNTNEKTKRFFGQLTAEDYNIVQMVAQVELSKMLVPEYISEADFQECFAPPRPPNFWEKMGKAFGGGPKVKRTGVFGVELVLLIERSGVDSSLGVGSYSLRIPSFVDDIINAMRQKDLSVEGIFRKNGNIRRIREFSEIVDKGTDISAKLADENIVQLAALLKRFLREMPIPLLGEKLGKLFVLTNKVEQSKQEKMIQLLVCSLQRPYRDMLEVLMAFLNWSASFSQLDDESGSKMDAHNLATVITPNILPPSTSEGEHADMYLQAIEAVRFLIEQHTLTAHVPEDIQDAVTAIKDKKLAKLNLKSVAEVLNAMD